MPTIGDRAEFIEANGMIDEDKVAEILKGIETAPVGSINGQLTKWLLEFVEKRKNDALGIAVDEQTIGLDAYVAKKKVEILEQILPVDLG